MQFEFKFQAEHLKQSLMALRHEVATPDQMLGSLGEALLRVNQDRHEQGLAPDGTPWKELAESTKKLKKGGRILYSRGDLLRFSYQITPDGLVLGTNDWKAAWHHFGTEPYTIRPVRAKALKFGGIFTKRVNHPGLPSRKLIGFPDSDKQLAADVIHDHLLLTLNRVR